MRIVAGRLRGRRLLAPEDRETRPTSDRARESLFDILTQGRIAEGRNPVLDARVLDAFAGTGALGLEALSRGAATAVFIEQAPAAVQVLRQNIRALGLVRESEVLTGDATRPPRARAACSIVLMDPPYRSGLAGPALTALAAQGWIAPEALIAVELDKDEGFEVPVGFEALDERRYGKAQLVFLKPLPLEGGG